MLNECGRGRWVQQANPPLYLKNYLSQAVELTEHGLIHIRLRDLTRYLGLMSSAGYPPVHHSEEFNRAYHPAYRVVARRHLPKEWLKFER